MRVQPKYRVIASVLLFLFLSFQGGRMMCYHTHVFGNTVISHSHPFNNPDRSHTVAELEAFALIGATALTDNSASAPEMPFVAVCHIEKTVVVCSTVCTGFRHSLCGRAPPAFEV